MISSLGQIENILKYFENIGIKSLFKTLVYSFLSSSASVDKSDGGLGDKVER